MKVFSKEKFINQEGQQAYSDSKNWVNECDGLTKEEMEKLGFSTLNKWMIEKKVHGEEKKNKADINLKVNVDDEELEDTVDMLREVTDLLPSITIRNNEQVYVTINNFNTTAKEYYKED